MKTKTIEEESPWMIVYPDPNDGVLSDTEKSLCLQAMLVNVLREIRDEMKSARKEAHRRANRGF